MKQLWAKLPGPVQGFILMAGLIGLIVGIPMAFIKGKRFIRRMQLESHRNEMRPAIEDAFAPFRTNAELVYNNLQKLSKEVPQRDIASSIAAFDSTTLALYTVLSQLPEGGVSEFQDSSNQPSLHLYDNTYFGLAEDIHQAKFLTSKRQEEYCAHRIFHRFKYDDWDHYVYHPEPDKEKIETCMKQVANSQYLLVWHERYHKPAVSTGISFRSGQLFGQVDVYDIQQMKIVNYFYALVKSSTSVSSFTYDKNADKEAEMEKAFKRDLEFNVKSVMLTNFAPSTTAKQ